MYMTDGEIVRDYLQARNKPVQIKILAEINACKQCDIKKILIEAGVIKPVDYENVRELYDRGLPDERIAVEAETSVYFVRKWRLENNLPSLKERNRLKRGGPDKKVRKNKITA